MKLISFITLVTLFGQFSNYALASDFLGPQPHERTDTPKKSNANVGRYLYVGSAPKFSGSEIELIISKMSLTLRAQGWITQDSIDNYASQLYQRWERIDQTLQDPNFQLHPLIKLSRLATKDTSIAWTKIAEQYSSHILENRGIEIYNSKRNVIALENAGIEDEYRQNMSTAILRYYFNDNSLSVDAIKNDNKLRDKILSASNSQQLFKVHLGSKFTDSKLRVGHVGFITWVYPIAASVAGPFDQPAEGVRTLMSYGTIESRWWSDKWDDEFGGLPFILIEPSGVAFHGPITNFAPLDVWYLKRGYVSHGCHRMDTSDVIELRHILPKKVKELGKVKLTILNNFDVTDWNGDGKEEVIDVKYYNIPSSVVIPSGKKIEEVIRPYMVEAQMKSFFSSHAYAKKYYDASSDTIKGNPKYTVIGGKLSINGTHQQLPIKRFEYQPSRVLQYKELGTQMYPYDDNQGKYPPTYFLQN
jgi:hypothetical protein